MRREELLEHLEQNLETLLAPHGVEVVDLQYRSERGNMVLRVFIDTARGVDLDTCEKASRIVSDWLDQEDPLPGSYLLEVSSPGLDRILKKDRDFARFVGREITVKTREKIGGTRKFKGILSSFSADEVVLSQEGTETAVPRHLIAEARLVAEI